MKLLKILLEQEKILVPRRIKGRPEKHLKAIQQKIQQYIKDGSKGNLDLHGTPIKSLPDNLKSVGGDLGLSDTPITSLPDNLKYVGGNLWLPNTPIKSLPKNLEVRRDLYIENSALAKKYTDEEIRNLADIGGDIIR